jgi:hypothetical protein
MAKVMVKIKKKTAERTYEINGVEGAACDSITEIIERSNEVLDRQYTEEFYDEEQLPDYVNEGEG